jgi:hypothetical protein
MKRHRRGRRRRRGIRRRGRRGSRSIGVRSSTLPWLVDLRFEDEMRGGEGRGVNGEVNGEGDER